MTQSAIGRRRTGGMMVKYTAKRNSDRCPTHPGAVLREDMLPASGKKKIEIARLLGISGGPGIWVRMQAAYDTWHAERNVDVSGIPTLKVA
jgi:antitoxin HigA-1